MIMTRDLWIDPRWRRLPHRPWRKVILDFNNTADVRGVGAGFDPTEFGATLRGAHADAAVVIAKDVNGTCYFPTTHGPQHPEPGVDQLLGRQVAACREIGIQVQVCYPYWDDTYLATEHPEWLVVRRGGQTDLIAEGEPVGVKQLCISHPELLELVLQHTTEIVEHCEPDGLWYDMLNPAPFSVGECFCDRCVAALRKAGEDPDDFDTQQCRQDALFTDVVGQLSAHVRKLRPDLMVEYNTMAVLGSSSRMGHFDSVEVEALPTGMWGYGYLPLHGRYARSFGTTVYGLTGRFVTHWGDYGGLKHPTQLRSELAAIVAQGFRCDIGDDPGPSLRLDQATYATIGEAYAEIERIEPYLTDAAPVIEAAIVVDGLPLGQLSADVATDDSVGAELIEQLGAAEEAWLGQFLLSTSVSGLARLLTEHEVQYDVVDATSDWTRYRLVVLPESLVVDPDLAERLRRYLAGGGAVVAAGNALLLHGQDDSWADELRGAYAGPTPFDRPYTRVRGPLLGHPDRYARYDFALYGGSDRWAVNDDRAMVHAVLTEPTGDPMHLADYAVPASGVPTEFATVLEVGRLGAFSFPIGRSYFQHGYWVYRELFGRILHGLLPTPLVRTSAPPSAEVSVTHQEAAADRPERWIVHLVTHSPLRGRRGLSDRLDAPAPLRDVTIELAVQASIVTAVEARSGCRLPVEQKDGSVRVTVPEVDVAATVVLEVASSTVGP